MRKLILAAVLAVLPVFSAMAAGALAVDDGNLHFGWSNGQASQHKADHAAMQQCGATTCRVVARYQDSCIAYAGDRSGTTWGLGQDTTADRAIQQAQSECHRSGGHGCRVKVMDCDGAAVADNSSAPAPMPMPMPIPTPSGSPPTAGTDEAPAPFTGMVAAHNEARHRYSVPPLTWSADLAAPAQTWADHLKDSLNCAMQHSQSRSYGENLAWASGTHLMPEEVVRMWVDEAKNYDAAINMCRSGAVCGHFTQVVWKTTTQVGCGLAHCGTDEIWVCEYSPPGNWVGKRPF
ncbi:MAG: DUF4189 domain-containing protein [Alphaproteobacteria bacterium]|nr:DUF4189 domain-containing protein [Alphaproteobacteria bacterium]